MRYFKRIEPLVFTAGCNEKRCADDSPTRLRQVFKNILVFVALACSGRLFDAKKLIPGVWGFLAFCVLSSAIYVINDIAQSAFLVKKGVAQPWKH